MPAYQIWITDRPLDRDYCIMQENKQSKQRRKIRRRKNPRKDAILLSNFLLCSREK